MPRRQQKTMPTRALQDLLDRELDTDETLLWSEMPIPKYFTPESTGAFLFAIPWTAISLFVFCILLVGFKTSDFSSPKVFFPLFILLFVLPGFAMLSTPYWTYRRATKTIYAITEKRVITIEGGFKNTTIKSYYPDDLHDIHRVQKSNGTGNIILHKNISRDSDGDSRTTEKGLMNITDVKHVESLVKSIIPEKS